MVVYIKFKMSNDDASQPLFVPFAKKQKQSQKFK